MITFKEICVKCGNEVEVQLTMLGMLKSCKEAIWQEEIFKDLSDELKKDFALSLFIAVSKDKTTDKIQYYKTANIKAINR